MDYDKLAIQVKMKSNTLKERINAVKPFLFLALSEKYWNTRPRPKPLTGTNFPYIGMLVDHNSTQIYRPHCPFNEAKRFYDKHNAIYALKKEVGIQATPPHYALFVHKHA